MGRWGRASAREEGTQLRRSEEVTELEDAVKHVDSLLLRTQLRRSEELTELEDAVKLAVC